MTAPSSPQPPTKIARRDGTTPAAAAPARENLLNLTPDAAESRLREFVAEHGLPSYRAGQIARRLWQNPAPDFEAMTELPKALRELLAAHFSLPRLALAARQSSSDGTQKFLFRLADGEAIETVAIPDGDRMTLCISSQAGCALKCSFCSTGVMGFSRNLEVHEIAGQVRELRLLDAPIVATNIVFMGMGEPMMNWKAVDPTLTILNSPAGLGIGARHITISTVGVLPGIVALGERPEQFRLAISIHAPSDELRQQLMPINTKYPLADVIAAAAVFDRRVTFEYVMLGGVNDRVEHALQLAKLARDCRAFVNLIPLHPGGAMGFTPTPANEIQAFARELRDAGIEVAIRKSRGIDIAAACGQLRVERLGRRAPRRPDLNGDVQVA
ncbi:MAG TPA: 23S rRNA (adenine(2503)-C(2))-methyltransferase RlmN [Gemmatimonadaceae bacterium]|nr:23S rRNA (adenine(2503)-C(2))-methyltransferase RlmN [Gemmatimonadaceae bacterium]